jgi:murein DD-endopeptidase MepM/ murein hydrolase activator NlpD
LLALAIAAISFAAACDPPPPEPAPEPAPLTAPDPTTFACPVVGSTYTDNYGPRPSGFHYGLDMFQTFGTAEVAVGPGRVTYQVEDAGGNAAYLWADDGNVYYYAHMWFFAGDNDRRVEKGDTIGVLGQSGNATAPHLHFEIRLGGPNGLRMHPSPPPVAAGC